MWNLFCAFLASGIFVPIAAQSGDKCVTVGGKHTGAKCIFPFLYDGTKYNGCTSTGHSQPWCATIVDGSGGYVKDKWGNCAPACKLHSQVPAVVEPVEVTGGKADIAFILRGYYGDTLFPTPQSFKPKALDIMTKMLHLSFGKVKSFQIFDAGVEPEGINYYQSLEDIIVIDACLDGWPTPYWSDFRERDEEKGEILVNPTALQIKVLNDAKLWMLEHGKDAYVWREQTQIGKDNWDWIRPKVLRYGGSAAMQLLKNMELPSTLDTSNFRVLGIIFSTLNDDNMSSAQLHCIAFGLPEHDGGCFYADVSNLKMTKSSKVVMHEMIHAFGMGDHDDAQLPFHLPYSLMNQGPADSYPMWDRIYIQHWISDSIITTDFHTLSDTKYAGVDLDNDKTKKYLLRLGPESDFECKDGWDNIKKCHQYQEMYEGTWIQYKTLYTENGNSYLKGGVRYVPLNDPTDKNPPIIRTFSSESNFEVIACEDKHEIIIEFNEIVSLGYGEVRLQRKRDGRTLKTFRLQYLPSYSDGVQVKGNLVIFTMDHPLEVNTEYTLAFNKKSITDRAGNSIDHTKLYGFKRKSHELNCHEIESAETGIGWIGHEGRRELPGWNYHS